jgi:hypothetical protein
MHHSTRVSLLVAVVLLTASCSDTDAPPTPIQPTELNSSRLIVNATSAIAVAEPVSNPLCPTITPFNVRLGVIVRATGSEPVVITGIRTVFTDTSGRQAPQVTLPMLPVTLPAIGPTQQFGTPVRTFPIVLGIGCGTDTNGTVAIIVDTTDHRGRRATQQVTVPVR